MEGQAKLDSTQNYGIGQMPCSRTWTISSLKKMYKKISCVSLTLDDVKQEHYYLEMGCQREGL